MQTYYKRSSPQLKTGVCKSSAVALTDHFKPTITLKNCGDIYALFGLVVLKKRRYDTWQSECAAIETMCKLRFSFFVAVPAFKPVGLKTLEIAYAAYFKPALLGCSPFFKVISKPASKTHTPSA